MMLLLKNGEVYAPDYIGIADVLVLNGKIAAIERGIDITCAGVEVEVRNLRGMRLTPGFVDNHAHIAGGGGELGFESRTPETAFSSFTRYGVTTVVGVLGMDASRGLEALLAKARSLAREGITAYILTCGFPLVSLTGSARRDIVLIEEVLGVGEVTVSDSPLFSAEELARVAAETRAASMLSGKAGVLNLCMGNGKEGFGSIFKVLKDTDIPIRHFLPTHVTHSPDLFAQSKIFAALGGIIDITAGTGEAYPDAIPSANAVNLCLEGGVPIDNVTLSSNTGGLLFVFDSAGNVERVTVCSPSTLQRELKALVTSGLDLSMALKPFTSNPARTLGLPVKGRLAPGCDADILILDSDMNIDSVFAQGRLLVESGRPLVKGKFEQ
ncbi:MAG: beta-aspartyl-peptidase [Synergistaceae bacterium]|jgi:beta-aspartyl-dipeptidase (metallo-type)|nr:beta-aspartyl-peptidase [Synergistaceae bacterium]